MLTTAEIERALITALDTIATHWDALNTPSLGGSIAGPTAAKSLINHDDNSDRTDDLPRDIIILDLRHDTTLALNSWSRLIIEEKQLRHRLPLGTDTIGLVEFLQRWARWFSGHEAAADAASELTGYANRVQTTATPPVRDWINLGKCPLEVEVDAIPKVCGGSVRARGKTDPECQRCGTKGDIAWWERVMFPDIETSDLVTADELVILLRRAFGGPPVKPSTIRQWIRRGVIECASKDPQGRSLYSRRAVIEALDARHAVAD